MSEEVVKEDGEHRDAELNQAVEGGSDEAEVLKRELAESKDRFVRLMADFENLKRRTLKEQSELLKYQGEKIIVDLLEVLDNLELALAHSSANEGSLKAGLEMVHKIFIEKLGRWDIRGEQCVGAHFDPVKHAAVSKVPGKEPGVIVAELKKPYYYKDKLIRCGEVVVAVEGDNA